MNKVNFPKAIVALILLAGACSPTATSTSAQPTSVSPVPSAGMEVNVGQDDKFGAILVDGNNMTLYLFTSDTPNTSTCYGQCVSFWPPLLTSDIPTVGEAVDMARVGTTTREDGSQQITYNGWPLYYYYLDRKAGETNGQGFQNVWYVISPVGEPIIE